MTSTSKKYSPSAEFMDASAAVTASRFASSRLSELQDLWKAVKSKSECNAQGCQQSLQKDVFLPSSISSCIQSDAIERKRKKSTIKKGVRFSNKFDALEFYLNPLV